MHPEAAVRFEIDNVSLTVIEHFEQADPAHAWRVAYTNYMPRELVSSGGGSKA
jgi:alpha-ribazole phosphatase